MAVFEENINLTKCSYLLDSYTFADFFADFDGTQQDAKIQFKKLQTYLTLKLTGKTQYAKYKYTKLNYIFTPLVYLNTAMNQSNL